MSRAIEPLLFPPHRAIVKMDRRITALKVVVRNLVLLATPEQNPHGHIHESVICDDPAAGLVIKICVMRDEQKNHMIAVDTSWKGAAGGRGQDSHRPLTGIELPWHPPVPVFRISLKVEWRKMFPLFTKAFACWPHV